MNLRVFVQSTLVAVLVLAFAVSTSGCSSEPDTTVEPAEEQSAAQTEETATSDGATPGEVEAGLYTPAYEPNGSETAVIATNKGAIKVELYGSDAPIHVGNFVELSQKGFYDDTKFHRYEPGFVIQGGDPLTKDATSEEVAAAAGDPSSSFGTGDPGYKIKAEYVGNPNKHVEGALGMARSQDPDSAGSQFYFTLAATPFLDGQYTVFGKVIEGMDVVTELRAGDVIESVTVEGASE